MSLARRPVASGSASAKPDGNVPPSVDAYIAAFEPKVRAILRKVRATVRKAAPDADEAISYRMPCMKQGGVLVYYAGFTAHLGLFPPVAGDASLVKALARWAGPKGNLRFPYDEPIPYGLIARIVRLRVRQNAAKAAGRPSKRRSPARRPR